ncbi:MAG: cell wall metabolism sensor histidine kinase WalK [Lachnospiraceae bacterium]|nr:cell wall metabolism sensor histidine kinase WalK [Lachnospiraceae bacterium]
MENGGQRRNKNRLFLKTYLYFAVMVLLVAAIIGGIFLNVYQSTTRRQYRERLENQADRVKARFEEFIRNEDYSSCLSYLEILLEIGDYEIWSLANPYAEKPMNRAMTTMDFSDVTQKNYTDLIYSAFLGKERFLTSYSEIHGCTMMSAGVPIRDKSGEVCGALLINSSLEMQDMVIQQSKYMILFSILAALGVSFFIAFLFARQLSRPVLEIRDTALLLAEGDYAEKTGISRKDEIGELARTMDFLADKLSENEEIRRNLEQMRMDFFANVSHELRTPITVIRAYTETLVDGVVTEEEKVRQYYDRMLSECKSMERLVGDLLLLAKMQNPDFEVDKEPVNLVQIFDEIIRSAGAIGAQKKIHISVEREKDLYMIQGDYDRLRQMFLVIFDNAVKFSPEGGNVYVTLKECGEDRVRVSIRDEGIGISKEELPSIFEKFYKSKLRQNAKGSGLGLAIARQIALKHGGDIEVESEPGVGTEFGFTFRLIPEKELNELMM